MVSIPAPQTRKLRDHRGAFPGHTVGRWSLTPRICPHSHCAMPLPVTPTQPPSTVRLFPSQIPDPQGALSLEAFGHPKLLEPLYEPPSQAALPLPKVFAPAWAMQARTLTLGGGGVAFGRLHRPLFPLVINMGFSDNAGGWGGDAAVVPMAVGQTWTPHCCDQGNLTSCVHGPLALLLQ